MTIPQDNQPLAGGTEVGGYRIERPISAGGFSIVYLACDKSGKRVAIKEYVPAGLAVRKGDSRIPTVPPETRAAFNHGMRLFFEEGRMLADLHHPNVVEVLDIFRANETAYLVMRFEEGHSLHHRIHETVLAGISLEEPFLRNLFVQLLNGLREVHTHKLLHLDIKPSNIYVRRDGQPVLLDFGASRRALGGAHLASAWMQTPGYAAPEQQGSGEALGPWTDIYSVGASLYACLSGHAPPAAAERLQSDCLQQAQRRWRRQYSQQLLELIDWCLCLPVGERPQSVFALQKVLNGELLDLVDPAWFAAEVKR